MRVEEEGSLSEAGVANFGVGGGSGNRHKAQGSRKGISGSGFRLRGKIGFWSLWSGKVYCLTPGMARSLHESADSVTNQQGRSG